MDIANTVNAISDFESKDFDVREAFDSVSNLCKLGRVRVLMDCNIIGQSVPKQAILSGRGF